MGNKWGGGGRGERKMVSIRCKVTEKIWREKKTKEIKAEIKKLTENNLKVIICTIKNMPWQLLKDSSSTCVIWKKYTNSS